MKRKDIQSLHNASISELQKRLSEKEVSLAQMVKDRYTKQSKNIRQNKFLRLEISRIKTILRAKELTV
jgi:ribosomal protein L29